MQHPFRALDFAPFTFRGVHASMSQLPLPSSPTETRNQRCHTAMLAAGFGACTSSMLSLIARIASASDGVTMC